MIGLAECFAATGGGSVTAGVADASVAVIGVDTEAVTESLRTADGAVAYALVFILAAIPWFEILLVIPPAIALGFDPLLVTALALFGNLSTVLFVIVFQDRVLDWYRRRRDGESSRSDRARRLWDRYGLPVLAGASPIVTGSHIGAALALLFGSPRNRVAGWMTVSLVVWAVGIAALSVLGISALGLEIDA